jgi:hypothetical protein
MMARHSQGKTSSPRAVNPIGMQLPPDELAWEELAWEEFVRAGCAGDGWFTCATFWSRGIVSPAVEASHIATVESINTKTVLFIVI